MEVKVISRTEDLVCENCIWVVNRTQRVIFCANQPPVADNSTTYYEHPIDSFCKEGQWAVLLSGGVEIYPRALAIRGLLNEPYNNKGGEKDEDLEG